MMNEIPVKPRTIAYVVPMGKGLDSFVYREVEHLLGKGLDIVLFSTKFRRHDVYSPRASWKYYTLGMTRLALYAPVIISRALMKPVLLRHALAHRSMVELVFALYYAPLMRKTGAQHIHCHFGDRKLTIGYYCKRLLGLPLSVTIHSHELHVNPNEKIFRIALSACDRIFAISQLAVDLLVSKFNAPAERVMLSRLFLDLADWSDDRPVRVITVARFEPQKGFEYLFRAAGLLADLNIEFVVVGFGPLDVRAMARELGVYERVVFFDKLGQDQLRLLYQCCDIYCLPSIMHPEQGMEGIPVVLMEAMACGLPVVATDAGAVNEIVGQFLVREKSPEQMAAAIRALAADPELRRAHAARNREIVEQRFSVRNIEQFATELASVELVGESMRLTR